MTQHFTTATVSTAVQRGLLACGLLLGLTGCPDDDHSGTSAGLSASMIQQAYLKASNPDINDKFGYAVALDGDTLVVGVADEDSNATGVNGDQTNNTAFSSGAVYVFIRSGGVWAQQAYLKASNTEANDEFGWSVALSGDTLVVGAYQEDSATTGVGGTGIDNTALNSGAAYVFTRSGGVWSQQAYLKASNTEANDAFGYAVAVSGDTLVVGAHQEDSNETGTSGLGNDNTALNSGAAYVFTRSGSAWTQQAYLKASNTETNDAFGYAVALDGDTLVVGALGEDSNETGTSGLGGNNTALNSGAAYVFTRSGSAWTQQAYVKASNTEANDEFGRSLALSGDTLVVGAYQEDGAATGVNGTQSNGAADSGAVYVFTRSGSAWTQQAYLKASNTEANNYFGWSVALSGDRLVVGAYPEESNATGVDGDQTNNSAGNSGAAYVFTRNGGVWSQQSYVKASNTELGDSFGYVVAVSGGTVAVGAMAEDSNATGVNGNQADNNTSNSGAVYVFQ